MNREASDGLPVSAIIEMGPSRGRPLCFLLPRWNSSL